MKKIRPAVVSLVFMGGVFAFADSPQPGNSAPQNPPPTQGQPSQTPPNQQPPSQRPPNQQQKPGWQSQGGGQSHQRGERRPHPCRRYVREFCKDIQPGQGRIMKCLADNKSKIKGRCAEMIDRFSSRTQQGGNGQGASTQGSQPPQGGGEEQPLEENPQ